MVLSTATDVIVAYVISWIVFIVTSYVFVRRDLSERVYTHLFKKKTDKKNAKKKSESKSSKNED